MATKHLTRPYFLCDSAYQRRLKTRDNELEDPVPLFTEGTRVHPIFIKFQSRIRYERLCLDNIMIAKYGGLFAPIVVK